MAREYRDLAVETQSDEIVLLRERVSSLEEDVEVYREIAQQAIHTAHDVTVDRDRLRRQNRELRDRVREILGADDEDLGPREDA